MKKTVRSLDTLKDSQLLFDKEPPAFGYLLILIVGVLLCLALVWSIKTPKVYTIQVSGIVTDENANYVMSTYTGEIDECFMEEGQLVEEGDILFSIKSVEYDLQEEQLLQLKETYEIQISQYELLVQSIKDDTNYFDESDPNDSMYYNTFEIYKAQVAQNVLDTSTYQSYGYTEEQIEALLIANQEKIDEIYYTSIQAAERAIQEAELQIDSIDAQLATVASGQETYAVKATATGVLHLLGEYKSGMVVQTSTSVATITPENSLPVLEAYVSTADMARMNEGDSVQIVIDGLAQSVYGTISGSVVSISSDVSTLETNDGPTQVFRVLIEMDSDYLVGKDGDKVDISNGMTAVARIQYDKVSYMNYILEKLGFKAN